MQLPVKVMNDRIRSFAEPYTGQRAWKDPNVKRLVQAWIARTPTDLNVTFEEFLLMPSQKVERYGTEFATKHRELIRKILMKYADSLNAINDMVEPDDKRGPLGRIAEHYGDESEDEDGERLYARDFDEEASNLRTRSGDSVTRSDDERAVSLRHQRAWDIY